jgi:retron-type reverse transcriptase
MVYKMFIKTEDKPARKSTKRRRIKRYKSDTGGKREKKNGSATGGIITGVKLEIKEKRQEKGEEERCMERKVHYRQ